MTLNSLCRLIAVVVVIGAAAGAVATPSAFASYVPGTNIFVSGSAEQSLLENGGGTKNGFGLNWPGLISTWRANPTATQRWNWGQDGYALTGNPTITFTATSAYAAFAEFGTDPTGDPTQDPVADAQNPPLLDGFIATDEAPSFDQLQTAENVSGSQEIEVPVAQAPLALIFSLPSGITLSTGARLSLINNGPGDSGSTLQAVFDGKVGPTHGYPANTWGAFLVRAGFAPLTSGTPSATTFLDTGSAGSHTGGYQPLELEVRSGDAPETNVLQTFMSMSGDTNLPSPPSDAEQNWPSNANDGAGSGAYPAGPFGANTTDATLVKNTLATPGTVGYALMGDAVFAVPGEPFKAAPSLTTYEGSSPHQYLFAAIQTDEGTTGTRHYAEPGAVGTNGSGSLEAIPNLYTGNDLNFYEDPNATSLADCPYTVGPSDEGVGDWCLLNGPNGQPWEGAASDPDVYRHSAPNGSANQPVNAYPIVEVTYDTAWYYYGAPNSPQSIYGSYTNATNTGNTVASYLNWVTKATGGQAMIDSAKVGWGELPAGMQPTAAAFASRISSADVS